ncbi:MAG: hypothetical protein ACYC3K_03380 [Candidatus Nanopelagicales bacterium]
MDGFLLAAYVVLVGLAFWRSRSLAWTVIMVTASVSVFGVLVNFLIDRGHGWTRGQLQLVLLVALLAVAALAFLRPAQRDAPLRRQALAIGVPVLALGLFILNMWFRWTDVAGFLHPVDFLMGHMVAEDNAKWLDFSAQYAAGGPIVQGVPMGGPLQLVLVFVGTAMAVVSQLMLGGYNEVAVAANTVVFGEFFMVIIAPLALAPLAEAWFRRPIAGGRRARIPWPLLWLGILVLVTANLVVIPYGHLTFQYTALVAALWCTTFLARSKVPRGRLLTSLAVAAAMTVWVPLNVLAVLIIAGWLGYLVARGARLGWRAADPVGIALVVLVAIGLWEPVRSSLAYLLSTAGESASGSVVGGAARGVAAAVGRIPGLGGLRLGIDESSLFAAGGGTETAGPILAILAGAAVLAAAVVVGRQGTGRLPYARLVPVGALAGYTALIAVVDQWSTGAGPHYGALKLTFLAAMVLLACCAPVGLLLLDPQAGRMALARWAGLSAVVFLLVVDTVLPRSVVALRPQQWSPDVAFTNEQSNWWPADVRQEPVQAIAGNPVGCVYLPPGAIAPSALTDVPDPQRAYACTRLLAGLAGADSTAQPLVDWLRREWLTNTPAWTDVYDGLAAMPQSVRSRPLILMDEASNVIGLQSIDSLLDQYSKARVQAAKDAAAP